jgi:hypothetical protein
MVGRQVANQKQCIEKIRHPKVRLDDPGTARRAILLNPDRAQLRRIRIDHCLAPANSVAADYVVSKPNFVDVIVELKGKNVAHAVDQIEATWAFWSRHEEHETEQLIGAWIMCSEYPRASTKVARYRENFRARGSILLISTHNGEERPFSDFMPNHP